jgi:plasmid stabilization system protein ParE
MVKKFEAMRIYWGRDALEDLAKTKRYLLENWSEKIAENFINEIQLKIKAIVQFPEMGRLSNKEKNVRKIIISKRHWMYYRVGDNEIEIVRFFDMKMDPLRNKYE